MRSDDGEEYKESELKKIVERDNEVSKISTACTLEDHTSKVFPKVSKTKRRTHKSVKKYGGKKSTKTVAATSSTI